MGSGVISILVMTPDPIFVQEQTRTKTAAADVLAQDGLGQHDALRAAGRGVDAKVTAVVTRWHSQMQNSKCKIQKWEMQGALLHFAFCILHYTRQLPACVR